jgi:hypothetical protein
MRPVAVIVAALPALTVATSLTAVLPTIRAVRMIPVAMVVAALRQLGRQRLRGQVDQTGGHAGAQCEHRHDAHRQGCTPNYLQVHDPFSFLAVFFSQSQDRPPVGLPSCKKDRADPGAASVTRDAK